MGSIFASTDRQGLTDIAETLAHFGYRGLVSIMQQKEWRELRTMQRMAYGLVLVGAPNYALLLERTSG
jgi:thiosulfate reductase cytochrome b subunit